MASETITMNTFPPTIISIGTGNFDSFMETATRMVAAKNSLVKIHFGENFHHQWHKDSQYLPSTCYPELTTIVLEIQPEIRKDYTVYNHRGARGFYGEYESVESAINSLADWLWNNGCPKLHTIRIEWAEKVAVSYRYYSGETEYDSEGPYREHEHEWEYEPLHQNHVVEQFFSELNIDWTWITHHDIKFILPAPLAARSRVPDCCRIEVNPSDDLSVFDITQYNGILAKYDESRNQ